MSITRHTTEDYHTTEIKNAFENFEYGETTFSHYFREPHAFLNGQRYGEAVFNKARELSDRPIKSVLEIGAGAGDLAFRFIEAWSKSSRAASRRYDILDLAPALIKGQKGKLKKSPAQIKWHPGNASHPPKSVMGLRPDVIIANEMIADLDVLQIKRSDFNPRNKHLRGLGEPDLKLIEKFLVNFESLIYPVGTMQLLRAIHQIAQPESVIFISEYFSRIDGGGLNPIKGHTEFNMNIDFLCSLARANGFSVIAMPLYDFFEMDLSEKLVSKDFLRFGKQFLGWPVSEAIPYTQKQIQKFISGKQKDLPWTFFSRADWMNIFSRFYMLTLRKRSKLQFADLNESLVPKQEENILQLELSPTQFALSQAYPVEGIKLNKMQWFVWKKINAKNDIRKILQLTSEKFGVPPEKLRNEVHQFIWKLYEMHFLYW